MHTRVIISRDGENIEMQLQTAPKWIEHFIRSLRVGGFRVKATACDIEVTETEIFPSLLASVPLVPTQQ